jgi:ZIP family zinc transporter
MTELFERILIYALLPAVTLLIGGIIASFYKIGSNVRSWILHFASGVVFSVVAVELLPDVVKMHEPVQIIIGFSIGIISMLAIKYFTEKGEDNQDLKKRSQALPLAILIAIAVDIVIDGLLLGIGFSAGAKEGKLLAFALSVEVLSLGLATATSLGERGIRRSVIVVVIAGLSLLFFVSAVLGGTLLHNLSDSWLEIILSFGLAALLFLVTEELLKEAHEEKESAFMTAAFFIGFLLFLIIGIVG